MRIQTVRVPALLLLAVLLFSTFAISRTPVSAQAEEEKIVCDSDLILNLYIANHYFNLSGVLEGLAASPATQDLTLDLSTLELGQYERLFTEIDESPITIVDQETVDAIVAELSIPEADRMTAAVDPTNALQPAVITGEPAECSILRFQLNYFYNLVADLT